MTLPADGESVRHTQELTILNRIAEALNREVDLNRALHTALEHIAELFNLTTGWIFLIDEETDRFYAAATYGLPPALADHPRRLGGTCYCLDTYREGDMAGAANINAITCSRLKDLKEGTAGLLYHASIPLYARTGRLGVLNVASTDWHEIADDDLRLLHTVGDLVSIAIQRARLFTQSAETGAINERNRLAREIHDTIAQGLAGIALKLETIDALLENKVNPDRIREVVQQTLMLTRINIDEARRSVMDLRAAPLENRSLPEALADLIHHSPLETSFEVIGSAPPLSTRIAAGIFRVSQELINNVIKHAQASQLDVQLILTPERLRLVIEDNGIGFNVADMNQSGHFGLIGIKERVKLLDGKLDIASQPASGTIIEVTIPLDKPL